MVRASLLAGAVQNKTHANHGLNYPHVSTLIGLHRSVASVHPVTVGVNPRLNAPLAPECLWHGSLTGYGPSQQRIETWELVLKSGDCGKQSPDRGYGIDHPDEAVSKVAL